MFVVDRNLIVFLIEDVLENVEDDRVHCTFQALLHRDIHQALEQAISHILRAIGTLQITIRTRAVLGGLSEAQLPSFEAAKSQQRSGLVMRNMHFPPLRPRTLLKKGLEKLAAKAHQL